MSPAAAPDEPLEVLIVDDSAVVRRFMGAILEQRGAMRVETAADPLIARRKIGRRAPDVVVLDIEMPRMDGLTFLRELMREGPLPVVVCSGHAAHGSEAALKALAEGAVDVVAKPSTGLRDFLEESALRLVDTVRAAASARPGRAARRRPPARPAKLSSRGFQRHVLALGASTGGPEALLQTLAALPLEAPGVVIVQHMPEGFTASFARRLDSLCRIEVREAAQGDAVRPGRALIAPGNRHLVLRCAGDGYRVELLDGPLVSRHRPSVDVLFGSVARAAGGDAVGALLTGMGDDGARGLLEMRAAGAATLAQDEDSCVVYGMPKEAVRRGAAEDVVSLEDLPRQLLERATRRSASRAGAPARAEG